MKLDIMELAVIFAMGLAVGIVALAILNTRLGHMAMIAGV